VDKLSLTFDDGPDPEYTPRLLKLLSRAKAKATFFVIAPRAQGCRGAIERMLAEGHTVGLHCDEHVRHIEGNQDWVRADTATALRRLRGLGADPTLWRTPWGATADWTPAVAAEHGLRVVGWTVDTNDWRGHSGETMFAATSDLLTADAIVLAHDGIGPGALRSDARETLAYVEQVIEHARARELTLGAI
jgi:peptidoglycan/xylan/chitin deacetylase (PgdA/CDA1 family)